jgi:hypothetical protein
MFQTLALILLLTVLLAGSSAGSGVTANPAAGGATAAPNAGGGASGAPASTPMERLLTPLNISPLIGRDPPPLMLARLADGKKVTLAEFRGRPVLVYFWATW